MSAWDETRHQAPGVCTSEAIGDALSGVSNGHHPPQGDAPFRSGDNCILGTSLTGTLDPWSPGLMLTAQPVGGWGLTGGLCAPAHPSNTEQGTTEEGGRSGQLQAGPTA